MPRASRTKNNSEDESVPAEEEKLNGYTDSNEVEGGKRKVDDDDEARPEAKKAKTDESTEDDETHGLDLNPTSEPDPIAASTEGTTIFIDADVLSGRYVFLKAFLFALLFFIFSNPFYFTGVEAPTFTLETELSET